MRVAVVGAGVYGCTIAVELARAGHQVDLYDRHRDLLHGATRANQLRLHSGYHYPRSPSTAKAALVDARRFAARFPGTINRRNQQLYAITSEGSRTSPDAYLRFCEEIGDRHRVIKPPSFLQGVALCVVVPEAIINIVALREQLRRELAAAGVHWHRDTLVDPDRLDHDQVVMATYGRGFPVPLRYEVTEVARVDVAGWYAFRSIIILDGPFCSLDPIPIPGAGGHHLLYHVAHSVHAANTGPAADVPDHLAPLLDQGLVPTQHSRFPAMLEGARQFLHHMDEATYLGSLFTIRAVLPYVDGTDERPTLIHRDGRVVHVLAGKVDGAVAAAERVVDLASSMVAA